MTIYRFLRAAASVLLALTVNSCVFPFDTDFEGQTGEYPLVVEGDIMIGGITTINLDRVRPFEEPQEEQWERYIMTNVEAYIEGEDGTRVEGDLYTPYDYFSSSYYFSAPTATIHFDTQDLRPDQRYRLHLKVFCRGADAPDTYETDWVSVSPTPVIDGLTYQANIPDEELEIGLSMHCRGAHHFRWSFEEDWEFHAELNSYFMFDPETSLVRPYDDYQAQNTYRCWAHEQDYEARTFSTTYQIDDRFEDLKFHTVSLKDKRLQTLYRIRVHLSALSDDAYTYWETMRRNSEEQGSLFAPTPSQLPGNIHCTSNPSAQVIGYVDACQEIVGEMYYDNSQDHFFIPGKIFLFEAVQLPNIEMWNSDCYYNQHYRPYQSVSVDFGQTEYLWAPDFCVDCRRNGGTKNKPADWPRD